MTKREVLAQTTFGPRIAEEEGEDLIAYFVETDQWKQVFEGTVDIVYGAKGSGKSAIYSLVLSRASEFSRRGITVIPAENPRGTPVFRELLCKAHATEEELRGLWKLYFMVLVAYSFNKSGKSSKSAKEISRAMEEAQLLPAAADWSLSSTLRAVWEYVRRIVRAEAIEGELKINSVTGLPEGVTGRIVLREPSPKEQGLGLVSVDRLFYVAQDVLAESSERLWIAIDRLDVAFADSSELESNALRALFRVYLDLLRFDRLSLKIFLRSDIWEAIHSKPFREASHITRTTTIFWDDRSILNLIIRRLLQNTEIIRMYGVQPANVLNSLSEQVKLFYRVFPLQIDPGTTQHKTLPWLLTRTMDGTRQTTPRGIIHLLSCAREGQLRLWELGNPDPPGDTLFDVATLKAALPTVSKERFEQTLCAEFPEHREQLEKLTGEKTEQSLETLGRIWELPGEETTALAERLVKMGFFERRGTKEVPVFWVPFLYRGALKMVQGSALSS